MHLCDLPSTLNNLDLAGLRLATCLRALTTSISPIVLQEWLGLRGPATMAGKPAATSVKVSQGVVPSVKEGSDGPSEKASLKLVEHPAAHAGEGGAPTFADAVKKRPYGSA